ncbi:MAG: Ig-like domain-containing protein [Nitriliruptoraceae bacterium]
MTDGGSTRARWATDLRAVLTVHRRNVHRVLILAAILIVALVAGMLLTLVLARPSLQSLTDTAAEGTRLATWQLLLASSWALVPVALMFGAGVAYIGMILRYADGAHTGRAVLDGHAWRTTLRRLPQAAGVVLAVGTCAVVTAGLAPIISVVALLALAATPIVRRQWPSTRWPSMPRLAWMAVPFVAAVIVAARGAMALPEVFLAGRGTRDALQAGWQRTRGQIRSVAPVLVAAAVAAMAGMWTLIALGMPIGSRTFAVVLEMSGTVLFAPLPIVALLVMYRATGGTSAPTATPPRLGEPGPVMPSVLSFALLATLVVPSASPAHAAGTETTTVTVTSPAPAATWTFGDAVSVTGTVTPDVGGAHPTGTVTLWVERDVAELGDPANWDGPVDVGSETLAAGDEGAFTFDGSTLPGGDLRLQVRYAPDDDVHAASESVAVEVTVNRRNLITDISTDPSPRDNPTTDEITVGDTIDVIVEIPDEGGNPDEGVIDAAPLEQVEFLHGTTDELTDAIGSATLVKVGSVYRATIEYLVTARLTYFGARVLDGETNYFIPPSPTNITRDEVDPAASSVELIAPAEVEYGGEATFHVDVTGPTGVPVAGQVVFQDDSGGGGFTDFGDPHTLTDGEVEVTFCASTDDEVCPPGGSPRLDFADEEAEALQIRARYVPTGIGGGTNALLESTSAAHTIAIDDLGLGICKDIELSPRIVDEHGQPEGFADPRILTASNCEDGGHLGGTAIALDAAPANGFELVEWRFEGRQVSTDERFVLRLPVDEWEDHRVEVYYQPVCHSIEIDITGSGGIWRSPHAVTNPLQWTDGDCELEDGTRGARHLSEVSLAVRSELNPTTDEFDVLYDFGPLAIDHDLSSDTPSALRASVHSLTFTADRDIVVPFEFGPVCRTVLTPATELGGAQLLTAPDCASPDGAGYTRNAAVTASVRIDDTSAVLAGWLRNGQPLAGSGPDPQVTFAVAATPTTTIEPEFTSCHTIEVFVDSIAARGRGGTAEVRTIPEANCFDGSERWLDGSTVTLRPLGSGSFRFGGWSDPDGEEGLSVRGTVFEDPEVRFGGPWPGDRRVVMDEPLVTTAHFYMEDAPCSTIRVLAPPGVEARFPDSGCGPGRYENDAKRRMFGRSDPVTRAEYDSDAGLFNFPETPLLMEVVADDLLTSTGWVTMTQSFEQGLPWRTLPLPFDCEPPPVQQGGNGSWEKTGAIQCLMSVRGDLTITLNHCQALEPTVNITRAGDDSGRVFSPRQLGLDDHHWITGTVSQSSSCAHPDARNPFLWHPDREVTLRAQAPALGFEFLDWGHVDFDTGVELFFGEDPAEGRAPLGVNVLTNNQRPTIRATVNYRAHCGTLNLGSNLRVEDSTPNCPGNTFSEQSYLVGSFVQVAADRTRGGRSFDRFEGVVANTTGLNDDNRPSALVLVRGDMNVRAVYPTGEDRFVSALATVGKLTLAVGALATLAGVAVACPPCGVALTALTASVFLLDLIPGMGGMATAALDLINPLSVLECAARWGFGTTGSGGSSDVSGVTATGATTIRSVRFAYEASTEGTGRAIGTITARGTTAVVGAGGQFVHGLYENRIDQVDVGYQTTEQLRDTATWNRCMNDKYRAAT